MIGSLSTAELDRRSRLAVTRSELPPGASRVLRLGGREIAVVNDGGRIRAFANRCPHQRASLVLGRVTGITCAQAPGDLAVDGCTRVVRCPRHRYEFDLSSGRCLADPSRFRIAVYDVRLEGEEIAVYV